MSEAGTSRQQLLLAPSAGRAAFDVDPKKEEDGQEGEKEIGKEEDGQEEGREKEAKAVTAICDITVRRECVDQPPSGLFPKRAKRFLTYRLTFAADCQEILATALASLPVLNLVCLI